MKTTFVEGYKSFTLHFKYDLKDSSKLHDLFYSEYNCKILRSGASILGEGLMIIQIYDDDFDVSDLKQLFDSIGIEGYHHDEDNIKICSNLEFDEDGVETLKMQIKCDIPSKVDPVQIEAVGCMRVLTGTRIKEYHDIYLTIQNIKDMAPLVTGINDGDVTISDELKIFKVNDNVIFELICNTDTTIKHRESISTRALGKILNRHLKSRCEEEE